MARELDEIRLRVSRPFLQGRGLEIGPGVFPQPVPSGVERLCFDLRTRAELAELFQVSEDKVPMVVPLDHIRKEFPQGADFLIAHQVLEHAPNPIGTLVEWHRLVRTGGHMVISLPDLRYCDDKERVVATLEHLLMDYLLDRGERAFESREHVYSFMFGWNDSGFHRGINKQQLVASAHMNANADTNDLHWHAFNRNLGLKVILAAAMFDRKSVEIHAIATPDEPGDRRTQGDLIYVYRLMEEKDGSASPSDYAEFIDEVATIERRYTGALARLRAVIPRCCTPIG
ncbi:MAG: class I SAM-dependent methyltransferase [Nitrospiraceae bacterium]